jgi:hypothetical protein
MRAHARLTAAALVFGVLVAPSCRRVCYGAMEKFGYEKRDILIDRVKVAQESQREAQEESRSRSRRGGSEGLWALGSGLRALSGLGPGRAQSQTRPGAQSPKPKV